MDKLSCLREFMQRHGVQAFITPSTDSHSGEYVPQYYESRRWLSGFTGSAGTAVVTSDKAALWTDSRYFIQAEEQLRGSEFELMKDRIEGTPTIEEWLVKYLKPGSMVGIDGWVNTIADVETLKVSLKEYGVDVRHVGDPFSEIWTDRPFLPESPVFIHDMQFAGETVSSKIARIRGGLGDKGVLISALDEVCWTLNLRGNDIEYNPVFVSYLVVLPETTILYINKVKVSEQVEEYLKNEGVEIRPYESIATDLQGIEIPMCVQADKTNYACYTLLQNPIIQNSPVSTMIIMKNETEVKGYHSAMLKDGIAMVKWLKWLLPAVEQGGQTELSLVKKLYDLRAEQPLFVGDSFGNIMAYGAHAAIVHYEPTIDTDMDVKAEGLLLCDVGSQYYDGTTDMTRTIPLGPLTHEMRRDYTLVLKGWINIARAKFPRGTCGTQLDVLARAPMWQYGINYLHGTGHGVGSFLNCHEGPHQIRMNYKPQPLCPGMTVTDEPGIYMEGKYGIRHENTLLVIEDKDGVVFGPYYKFESLTLCPIFPQPIINNMLDADEIEWLNGYHRYVCDKLFPFLDIEHQLWLQEMCEPIK
ncbi:MAG: aminopeptidase P family protein [Prevotellaceae bacterium]|nr:aminopeptidase P family protein [Candidatus Colivivens equi]